MAVIDLTVDIPSISVCSLASCVLMVCLWRDNFHFNVDIKPSSSTIRDVFLESVISYIKENVYQERRLRGFVVTNPA